MEAGLLFKDPERLPACSRARQMRRRNRGWRASGVMDKEVNAIRQSMAAEPGPVRQWIINHDDSRWFVGLYIGLAVVLSIWLGLFWLVAIVGVHLVFEWIRQAHPEACGVRALARAIWEIKLDLALVLFAFALALYLEVIAGAVGLGAGARLASQAGARAAAWQRVLRGVLLSLDDVAQVARVAARNRKPAGHGCCVTAAGAAALGVPNQTPWAGPWSLGDRLTIGFGCCCVLSILLAPLLTEHNWTSVWQSVIAELRPFP